MDSHPVGDNGRICWEQAAYQLMARESPRYNLKVSLELQLTFIGSLDTGKPFSATVSSLKLICSGIYLMIRIWLPPSITVVTEPIGSGIMIFLSTEHDFANCWRQELSTFRVSHGHSAFGL